VQQAQGRVRPTLHIKGIDVNDDLGLEREADIMGENVFIQRLSVENNVDKNRTLQLKNIQRLCMQMVVEICNQNFFSNPLLYFASLGNNPQVVEEPGSLVGRVDMFRIDQLVNQNSRNAILNIIDAQMNQLSLQPVGPQANLDSVDRLTRLYKAIQQISDEPSANEVYKKHTFDIYKLSEKNINIFQPFIAQQGNQNNIQTYHTDAGYMKCDPSIFEGNPQSQKIKSDALNGPFNQRGAVKGHANVDQLKHRFIAHVHVNKDRPNDVDIFNATPDQKYKVDSDNPHSYKINDELGRQTLTQRDKANYNAFVGEK
jgi:hypothetical protein